MVTFTICTNCVAPTAPFVSGGTNAKPNRSRLSWALCPSKLRMLVTPVSGPASGAATGSGLGLVIIAPVARAVGVWPLLPPASDEAPITIRDRGRDTSWREALITSGLLASASETETKINASETETKIKKIGKNHWKWRMALARIIEPPRPRTPFAGVILFGRTKHCNPAPSNEFADRGNAFPNVCLVQQT